jgi:hypothetical protein
MIVRKACPVKKTDAYCDGDAIGTCVPVPISCPEEYTSVSGCDWNTCGNRCLAQKPEVTLRIEGWRNAS